MITTTALYAGLLGLVAFGLALQCGRARGSTGITVGDGGNAELELAMRRHANFIEFVPLTLILIGILELGGVGSPAIHGLGGGLLVARLCHAFGFTTANPTHILRTIGAAGSTLVLVVASIWSIVLFV